MRIAFSDPRAFQFKPRGGGDPIIVSHLLEGLQQRGHELKTVSRMNVRRVWKGRTSARQLLEEIQAVHEEMKRFAPDAWLVYGACATNPDFFGWWQNTARYVLLAMAGVGEGKRTGEWQGLFQLVHAASLERADHVIACNPRHADELLSAGISRKRLSTLPLLVKGWDELPSRLEARRRLGLPSEGPVLFTAARFTLDGEKTGSGKTQSVLDLLACLPANAVAVIAGDGEGRPQVEQAATQLRPKERVRLVGPVDHGEMKWFYAACDVVAYPCQIDRPWMVVLEAQACGRPIVTMHTPSAELTVEAGRTGLLAKDLEEFRSLLAALVRDPARCESMGAAARDYVARNHLVSVRIGQIEEMLLGAGRR